MNIRGFIKHDPRDRDKIVCLTCAKGNPCTETTGKDWTLVLFWDDLPHIIMALDAQTGELVRYEVTS